MKRYAAFFDLDHTLLTRSSGRLFINYMFKKGYFTYGEVLLGIWIGFLHRIGIMDTEATIRKWGKKYKGTPEQVFVNTTQEFFNDLVIHHFRKSLLEEIAVHREKGGLVIIVSAATSYICNAVKDYLKLDDIICTELEIIDGKFTGDLRGKYIFGPEKLTHAASYCDNKGLALEEAYYYGDSLADAHLMEAVGNPVCVDPDWRLKRIADRMGWRIIRR